jgi:hypothetical protein
MITLPVLSRFRVSELLQFVYDVLSICAKHGTEKLQITPKVEALKADTSVLDTAFKASNGSSISEKIIAFDQQRDDCLTGIRSVANGFTYHFDNEISQAAQIILNSIDKYGKNIARLNYQSETSTINSLVNDWENDSKLKATLARLTLTEWVAKLKVLNNEFNNLYLSRVSEKAGEPQEVASECRLTVIESYKRLVKNIEARAEIDETKQFLPLITELNALVDKYNVLVNTRMAKSKAETVTPPAK